MTKNALLLLSPLLLGLAAADRAKMNFYSDENCQNDPYEVEVNGATCHSGVPHGKLVMVTDVSGFPNEGALNFFEDGSACIGNWANGGQISIDANTHDWSGHCQSFNGDSAYSVYA